MVSANDLVARLRNDVVLINLKQEAVQRSCWTASFVLSASHVVGYILLYAPYKSVDSLDGRPCVVGRGKQTIGVSERVEG